MRNSMLGTIVLFLTALTEEFLGPVSDLCEKLSGKNGGEWLSALKRFLRKENPWPTFLAAVLQPILKLLDTTTIVPAFEKFEAKAHFKKDTSEKAKVKIYWIGDNFKKNLLKKIETDVEKCEIRSYTLLRSSLDPEIMAEIGEERRITKLAHLWSMLERQGNGEEGPLLVNGYANVLYIEGENGEVFAVHARWHSGHGWYVGARSVVYPNRWRGGYRVFSR